MYNKLEQNMEFSSVRNALMYMNIPCDNLNKSTLRLILNCYCIYSYVSKYKIKIEHVFDIPKNNIYIEEINSKYKNFYNVKDGSCLTILAFNKLCDLLDNNNGELLSDYINSETIIKFKIDDITLYRLPCNINNTIKSINKLKENVKANGDQIIKFYSVDDSVIYVKIKTYDGAIIDIKSTVYSKFIQGRNNFNKKIKSNKHNILSPYYNSTTEVLVDFKCGHPPNYITPNSYLNGFRCKYCCNSIVEKGINDIGTTNPESVIYFKNIEDVYTHSKGSNDVVTFKCKECGYEKNMEIAGFFYFGFSCNRCSDGISYPNKFITNLLYELNESFQTEVKFEWCRFQNYKDNQKIDYGLFDIVIENKKIIIEMDGNLGHGGYVHTSSDISREETIYKDRVKEFLANKNGYKIIRIDCKYKGNQDRYNHVVDHIKNSELSNIYNLDMIDFLKIHEKCLNSLIKDCCNLWNEGYSTLQISKILHKSKTTIIKYLKDGNILNWCNYDKEIAEKQRIKNHNNITGKPCVAINNNKDIIGYFSSVSECSRYLSQLYKIKFYSSAISGVCRGEKSQTHNLHFQYITREEFNQIKSNPETSHLAFGDFFILPPSQESA